MILRTDTAKYIKVHRTEYEELTDFQAVAKYIEAMIKEFKALEKYLPKNCDSILDIGCGIAGIDILLMEKYPKAKLYLLDGDGWSDKRNGFNDEYRPYNSRMITTQALEDNGVHIAGWHSIGTKDVLKADLVISLLSWGYHYPLSTYEVEAKKIIVDVRDGHRDSRYGYKRLYRGENFSRCLIKERGRV